MSGRLSSARPAKCHAAWADGQLAKPAATDRAIILPGDPRPSAGGPEIASSASSDPASRASTIDPLLGTKLHVRSRRSGLVSRQRLLGLLDQGLACPLTLVSAPAGFGKTTLLTDWLDRQPRGACWLSLDAADNDPARFLSYVVAALRRAVPGLADDLILPLRSTQIPAVETVVANLVNELAAAPGDLVLVLDDYHVITSAAVNGALTFLLENLPPNLHLVISTRSDPAIPVARLRSRGQVVEVRADELRFTPDEAAAFLSRTMGLALSPEQVAALDERTEGWIAGLQMAALSMRGRDDLDGFIRAFAGTNRFILDFLVEEVLSREPQEVQTFLLQTAVLTRLCGPLCDAVTGASDGQQMLERLERRNLFVVPLDDERRWYRYHHLFADLLRARLGQSGPAPAEQLLSRAAEWCERDGQAAEAVGYALAARDYGRAADLIARYWAYAASTGEVDTVWSWVAALPEDVVRQSAPLGAACCWLLWLKGQTGQIEPHLVDAERALSRLMGTEGFGADDEAYAPLPAQLAALRSIVARYGGDFEAAVAHAERARDLMPVNLPPQASAQLRSVITLVLATASEGAGDLERAVDAYAETIHWSRVGRSATGLAGATYWLVSLLRSLGRLRRADEAARDALRFLEEQGMGRLPAAGLLHVVMGEVLLERNDLEAAESHLARGAELGRWSGRLDAVRNAAPALVRLRLARDDASGALGAVEEAESAFGQAPPSVRAELLALKARILVQRGSLSEAAQCAREALRLAGSDRGKVGDVAALAASRVLIAQGKPAEAVEQLAPPLAAAEGSGRLGAAIELRILRGLALARQGDTRAAETDIERALALAEPEGYARVFVDEGEPLANLLRKLASRPARTGESRAYSADYLAALLAAFGAPGGHRPSAGAHHPREATRPSGTGPGARPGRLAAPVEPLSKRELEVLRLLAEGLTNEQIARRLTIALGTAKTHVHNVSSKLGAQNRTETVARARELNLL